MAKKSAKKSKGGKPVANAETADAIKRLKEINRLGHLVEAKKLEVSKQETVVGNRKSTLEDAREDLSALNKELRGLEEDLAHLAVGGFPEHLPFTAPTVAPATPAADVDAWKSVPTTELLKGMKPAQLAKVLNFGLETFGQLEASLAKGEKIPGLGEAARKFIDDAREKYFAAHPTPAKAPDSPATVKRAKHELGTVLDDLLAFADVEASDENRVKVLASMRGITEEIATVDLKAAAVADLEAWTAKAKTLKDADVKRIFGQETKAAA